MDWMNQIGGLLKQYSGAQPGQAPDTVEDDFDQLTQAAPESALADGLSAASARTRRRQSGRCRRAVNHFGTQRATLTRSFGVGPTSSRSLSRAAAAGRRARGELGGGRRSHARKAERFAAGRRGGRREAENQETSSWTLLHVYSGTRRYQVFGGRRVHRHRQIAERRAG